ncbi:hypothetical protein NM208_g1808 [Fusarium decemcellulare]|uniref:Uncharacterized protein n=1 Tax=Fusarium decemcellulare TaxID=57161 RepID=A0ACC1SUL0_9HYPO|nr:hypothetical protein NM208_g1808 [Fusarium decemcellulare]
MLACNTYLEAAWAICFDNGSVVALMQGQGFTTVASSIELVVLQAVYIEKNAVISTLALSIQAALSQGPYGLQYLSGEEAEAAAKANAKTAQRPWKLWVDEIRAYSLYTNLASTYFRVTIVHTLCDLQDRLNQLTSCWFKNVKLPAVMPTSRLTGQRAKVRPGNLPSGHTPGRKFGSNYATGQGYSITPAPEYVPVECPIIWESTRWFPNRHTHSTINTNGTSNNGHANTQFPEPVLRSATPGLLGNFRSSMGRMNPWLDQARKLLAYIMLPIGFVAMITGIATYGRFFEGHAIFGGLAHWIKGGVFFWFGLFSLARWAGCFSELGWAWNSRPSQDFSSRWRPSVEFLESFLIFFYGSTNIFLEHLGGWGKAGGPKDLEHISITILFIGVGLCGMLIESDWLDVLLNTAISYSIAQNVRTSDEETGRLLPSRAGLSFNPIPALVIFILGAMIGSHHQSSMTSAMLHKQWGNLLASASVGRCLTYLILLLQRPESESPYSPRPPTELIVSFCLIAGGITFMTSVSR